MKPVRSFALATTTATAVFFAAGAIAAQDNQHQARPPAGAASAPESAPSGQPGMGPGQPAMQAQMNAMQAMHEKMLAAKTPQERTALLAVHMKTMQESMSMMQGMKGDGAKMDPAARQPMMEMRMDMMQSMMEMMMDRMPASPPK